MPPLANWLRRYRLEAGLSQIQVTKILGLRSSASICRWEHGDRVPSLNRLLELSVLYARLVNDLVRPQYLAARERVRTRLRTHGL